MKIKESEARELLLALKFKPQYVKAFDSKVLATKISGIPEGGKVKRPAGAMGKLFDKVIAALDEEDEIIVIKEGAKVAPAPAKGKPAPKKGKAKVEEDDDEDLEDEVDEDDEEEDSEDESDDEDDSDDDEDVSDDDEGDDDLDEDGDEAEDEDEGDSDDSEDDEDDSEDEGDDDSEDEEDVDADEDDGDDEDVSEDDEDESDEDETTDDDEDDEMEAPAKKKTAPKGKAAAAPSKNGKAKPTAFKSAAPPGKPGVIESIVEFLSNASEAKPISKVQIVSMLQKRFKGKDEDSLKSTTNQNVPNKLTKKGHNIKKNEKGYWIAAKGGKKK